MGVLLLLFKLFYMLFDLLSLHLDYLGLGGPFLWLLFGLLTQQLLLGSLLLRLLYSILPLNPLVVIMFDVRLLKGDFDRIQVGVGHHKLVL